MASYRPIGTSTVRRPEYAACNLRLRALWMLSALGTSIPRPATAQAVPYARTYAKSNEEVDKALKEMQAYAGQKLPTVEGFVANAEHPLDHYERPFYQFSIDLLPSASGTTVVRVTAKITAWYADRDPSKSAYEALPSNGRLELDLLDRLGEKLGSQPSASASRSDVPPPKPKLDLSSSSSANPLASRKTSAPTASVSAGTAADGPGSEEVAALRAKREAEEKRMRQLTTELQNLQEIQRNQAHPLNLVVVKKTGTPVFFTTTRFRGCAWLRWISCKFWSSVVSCRMRFSSASRFARRAATSSLPGPSAAVPADTLAVGAEVFLDARGFADELLERSNFGLGGGTSDLDAEAEGWLPSFSPSLSRRSNSKRPFDGRAS